MQKFTIITILNSHYTKTMKNLTKHNKLNFIKKNKFQQKCVYFRLAQVVATSSKCARQTKNARHLF